MRMPVVAIVGRPNVGKSTLFNRLAGRRISIVEDVPGVTRDRLYAEATHDDVRFVLIDTGGFEPHPESMLSSSIREQTQLAIDEADVVLFMVDVRADITPDDDDVANMLRKSDRPLVLAANKSDGPKQDLESANFYALGMDEVVPISAEHGRGIGEVLDAVLRKLPKHLIESGREAQAEVDARDDKLRARFDEAQSEDGPREKIAVHLPDVLRLCVIGKPNAGKSSLVNKLLGEDRHLVSAMPGTTMDSVDSFLEHGGRRYRLIDTAGIRRKRSISQQMERYAVVSALKGMDRADVAIFMIDAQEGLTDQDMKVAAFAHDKGKGIVLCINKWDLRKELELDAKEFTSVLRERMPFLSYAPIKYISALTGRRVFEVLDTVETVAESCFTRVSTSEVNRVIQHAMYLHPPPVSRGRRVKIYFAAQVSIAPPTFLLTTNDPKAVHFSYRRFLMNQLREAFGFGGSPVRLIFRLKGSDKGRAKNLEARKRNIALKKNKTLKRR